MDKKEESGIKKLIREQTSDYKRYVGALSKDFQHKTATVAEQFVDLKKDIGEIKQTLKLHTKILNSHGQILESHTGILNSHGQILESHTEMIGTLVVDVETLKTNVGVLKTDVAVLKTDVGVLKTDVSEIKTVLKQKADINQLARVERRVGITK